LSRSTLRASTGTFLVIPAASFQLSTADKDVCRCCGGPRDFEEQRPVINAHSISFLACSFPIYSRRDWFRILWNRFPFKLAFNRWVGGGHDGKGVFKI